MRSSTSLRRLTASHTRQCMRRQHAVTALALSPLSSTQRAHLNLRARPNTSNTTLHHNLQHNTLTQRHQPARSFATKNVEVPTIADSVTEGTVASINKAVGDAVEKDEVVIVLETDKVSVDIRSTVSGKIESIEVSDGDTVKVGQVVIKVAEGESGSKSDSSKQESQEAPSQSQDSKPQSSDQQQSKSSDSKPQQTSSSQSQQSGQHSTDDSHGRVPMIKFTHGRANQQPTQQSSKPQQQQQQQSQKSQPSQSSQQAPSSAFAETLHFDDGFEADNDRAYEAYKSLNSYYKRKRLADQQIEQVNLGGIYDPPAPAKPDKGGKPARK